MTEYIEQYDLFTVANFFEEQGDAAIAASILENEGRETLISARRRLFLEMCLYETGSPIYEHLLAGWLWLDNFLDEGQT